MDKTVEPPSSHCFSHPPLLVGKNHDGQWVVRDRQGLRGGLFVNRAEALKFAMFENGREPQAVIMVPGELELGLAAGDAAAHTTLQRRAA